MYPQNIACLKRCSQHLRDCTYVYTYIYIAHYPHTHTNTHTHTHTHTHTQQIFMQATKTKQINISVQSNTIEYQRDTRDQETYYVFKTLQISIQSAPSSEATTFNNRKSNLTINDERRGRPVRHSHDTIPIGQQHDTILDSIGQHTTSQSNSNTWKKKNYAHHLDLD